MKRVRQIFVLILTTVILSSGLQVFAAQGFRDVPESHFAFEAINWVADGANGAFMVGDASNNFQPAAHITKFEAAQIYAMAAGFRHITSTMPLVEREALELSFEVYRVVLDEIASEFTSWNRTFDREIAFLLHRQIVTEQEVRSFISLNGTTESMNYLSRQMGIVWMVRLLGRGAAALEYPMPPANPFRDDNQINPYYHGYIYYARSAGIASGSDNNINPRAYFTRAELAIVFHNALRNRLGGGSYATVTGAVAQIIAGNRIAITTNTGTTVYPVSPDATIMLDNTQARMPQILVGMPIMALVNLQGHIVSVIAWSDIAAQGLQASVQLTADEGFVSSVHAANGSITIRTQRVNISGIVVDSERTFAIASGTEIIRGGQPTRLLNVEPGDIAFFSFNGDVIHTLTLLERERTVEGELLEVRPSDIAGGNVLVVRSTAGSTYEFRILPTTRFYRDDAQSVGVPNMRIGDRVRAEIEVDRLVALRAIGRRHNVQGRLIGLNITEPHTQITLSVPYTGSYTFYIMPGVSDPYSLRIGMELLAHLDSREVLSIDVLASRQTQTAAVLGTLQSVREGGIIVVSVGDSIYEFTTDSETAIIRGTDTIALSALAVGENLHILRSADGSSRASNITVLP